MKKLIYKIYTIGVLCSLISLSSCQQELGDFNTQINFLSEVTPITRVSTSEEFGINDSFGVLGYCFVGGGSGTSAWDTKKAQAKPDIFYNQQVTVQEDGCVYQPPKDWSTNNQDKYTFFAYAPYDHAQLRLSSADQEGTPTLTYSIDPQNPQFVDVLAAHVIDHRMDHGFVPFEFEHVTSRISLKATNNTSAQIKINEVKLSGKFNQSVQLDMEDFKRSVRGQFDHTFSMLKKVQQVTSNQQNMTLDLSQSFYLIPEEGQHNYSLEITYQKGNQRKQTKKISLAEYTFAAGIHQTFQIRFLGDGCFITVLSQDEWGEGMENGDEATFN